MQVLLRIANGKSNVRKVRLHTDTVIGRSPDCQLKVASNQISRRHCQILINDKTVAIKDLGSANGTFVNGRLIPPEVEIPLTPGTRVMLGPLQFTIEYELAPTGDVSELIEDDLDTTEEVYLEPMDSPIVRQPEFSPPARGTVDGVPVPAGANEPEFQEGPLVTEEDERPVLQPPLPAGETRSTTAELEQTAYMENGAGVVELVGERPALPAAPAIVPAADSYHTAAEPTGLSTAAPVTRPLDDSAALPDFSISPAVLEQPGSAAPQEEFNFGIFAASGSDVIVESASEIPLVSAPDNTLPEQSQARPEKKGLLQLLGFGKKKPAPKMPEDSPATPGILEPPIVPSPISPSSTETVEEVVPLKMTSAEETVNGESATPDQSLQDFLNNLK